MKKSIRLFALGLYFSIPSISAQQAQTNWELSSAESGTKSYVARDYISLKPGFSYKAVGANTFTAKIDEYLLFPPSDKTYAKPDGTITTSPTEGGVVGAIPGQFAVSPAGAATYTIPIEVPAGINGMQPNLALVYNSQGGFGYGGIHFDIVGLSSIYRVPHNLYFDNGLHPVSFDGKDRFSMDGNRLILINGAYGNNDASYGFETDDYSRIKSYGKKGDGPEWFEMITKDGLRMEFGRSDDSRMELSDKKGVYTWNLNKVSDNYGNYIKYNYDSGPDGVTWIKSIEYAGNAGASVNPVCKLEFEYYELPEMGISSLMPKDIAGNKATPGKFIKDISTFSNGSLLMRYSLKYNCANYPKLSSVEVFNTNSEKLPSTTFEWTDVFASSGSLETLQGSSIITGDFEGEGKSGIALFDNNPNKISVFSFINEKWVLMKYKTFPVSTSVSMDNVGDINEDGIDDLLVNQTTLEAIPEREGGGTITHRHIVLLDGDVFTTLASIKGSKTLDPVSGNFYGDGRLAVIFCVKDGAQTYIKSYHNSSVSNLGFSDSFILDNAKKIYAGDFDGDGKSDLLIRTKDDLRFYSLESGQLRFKNSITKTGVEEMAVGDFNGDGIDDILITKPEKKFYYTKKFNISGYTEDLIGYGDLRKGNHSSTIYSSLANDFGNAAVSTKDHHEVLNAFCFDKTESTTDFAILSDGYVELKVKYTTTPANKEYWDPIGGSRPGIPQWSKAEFERAVANWVSKYIDQISISGRYEYFKEVYTEHPLNDPDGLRFVIRIYPSHICMSSFQRRYTGKWDISRRYLTINEVKNVKGIVTADFLGNGHNLTYIRYSDKLHAAYISKPYMKVNRINQGSSNSLSVTYSRLIHRNGVYLKERGSQYPILDYVGGNIVAGSVSGSDGRELTFEYEGGKVHREGRGFLGFSETVITDKLSKTKTRKTYKISPLAPVFLEESTIISQSETSSLIKSAYFDNALVPVPQSTRYEYRVNSVKEKDELSSVETTRSFSRYDNYGNPQTITTNYGNEIKEVQTLQYVAAGGEFPNRVSRLDLHRENKEESDDYAKSFIYYPIGKLESETINPGKGAFEVRTEYRYDTFGNITFEIVSNNDDSRSVSRTYTTSGRFLKTETNNQLKETSTFNFDETRGTLTSKTTPLGTTSYEYDGFGRLIKTAYPDKIQLAIARQWAGSAVSGAKYYIYEEASGIGPVKTWYDELGRELRRDYYGLGGKETHVKTEYNSKGLIWRVSEPYFGSTLAKWAVTYQYDNYGRKQSETTPLGVTTYTYSGLKTTVTTPAGKVETTLNSAGQVVNSKEDGKSVSFQYYPLGQVKWATPEGGKAVFYRYDMLGYCAEINDPDGGLVSSRYNGFGELVTQSREIHMGKPKTGTTYTYDPATKLLKTVSINGQATTYTYDTRNRLKSETISGVHSRSYDYDSYDRPVKVTETITGKAFVTSTVYDVYGRVQKETYPTGYFTTSAYDDYGYLTTVTDSKGVTIWEATEADAFGRLTRYKQGGRTTSIAYDTKSGLPTSIVAGNSINMSYAYDVEGHLKSKYDIITGQQETFSYDAMNRLSGWTHLRPGATTQTYSMGYDAATGGIKGKPDVGYTMSYGGSEIPPHALASVAGTPQALAGHLPQTISYNDFSKVSSIVQETKTHSITYGTGRQRVKSTFATSGSTTLTKYYLGNYEEEHLAGGKIRKFHYISGGSGLAAIYVQNNGTDSLYYTYCDYQGNLLAVTDASGNVKERYAYDPWGLRKNPADWSQLDNRKSFLFSRGYTLHEHLDDYGLINMNGRVYDPLMAQFLSPDPYIQAPGSWMNYNRYAYCLNNPLMYTDPSGYKWNWNWLNPVHWLSQGMQWINDNTTGLRQTMTDIGVPAFNVGYNTSDGSFHSFGNGANIYHNQFDPAVNANRSINEVRLAEGVVNYNPAGQGGPGWEPIVGTAGAIAGEMYYSKTYGTWMGKNFKMYQQTWGGNGATGGKLKFGKKVSTGIKIGGYGLGVWNAYKIDQQNRTGQITDGQMYMEQGSNLITTVGGLYGAAWGVGWELGRAVTNMEWYQEAKFNFWYNRWESQVGPPSQSNEALWYYFYQNYKP